VSCPLDKDFARNHIVIPKVSFASDFHCVWIDWMKTQERFDLIMSRQSRFEWGGEYVPSILAIPHEAPKGSINCRLHVRKLGRTLHLLSGPEKVFVLTPTLN